MVANERFVFNICLFVDPFARAKYQIKILLFNAIIRWSVCISMILFMCALFLLVNTRVKYDLLFESHFTSDKSMTLYGYVALILWLNVQRKGVKEKRTGQRTHQQAFRAF